MAVHHDSQIANSRSGEWAVPAIRAGCGPSGCAVNLLPDGPLRTSCSRGGESIEGPPLRKRMLQDPRATLPGIRHHIRPTATQDVDLARPRLCSAILPLDASRYFWRRLRGRSGTVCSIGPPARSSRRACCRLRETALESSCSMTSAFDMGLLAKRPRMIASSHSSCSSYLRLARPAATRYSTNADRPATSTTRASSSFPSASARWNSSPKAMRTGCGWPSLMAMLDA